MSKKKIPQSLEEPIDESWLLPYSDLMTLLLALFIVLFAMSSLDAKKFEQIVSSFGSVLKGGTGVREYPVAFSKKREPVVKDNNVPKPSGTEQREQERLKILVQTEQEELLKLKKRLDSYFQYNGLSEQLTTKLNESQLMITISDDTLFSSGQSSIKPQARAIAKEISKNLQAFSDYEVIIAGHTDNIPISNEQFQSNWDLSLDRALKFMSIVLLNRELDPKRFSAMGYGEYRPMNSNKNQAGRARNRRVEVSLVRKYQEGKLVIGSTTHRMDAR